jgi:hypothetical protein
VVFAAKEARGRVTRDQPYLRPRDGFADPLSRALSGTKSLNKMVMDIFQHDPV